MSAPSDTKKTDPPAAAPESPTTVHPFEMDDDDVQETGVLGDESAHPASTTATAANPAPDAGETPPAKPPRPLTEQQKNELILKEAFPDIDAAVIKAVLAASRGQIDPAFNALLGMSDPDAVQDEPSREPAPPPQPPRPTGPRSPMSQLEADELYARQLAQHYDNVGAYEARTMNRSPGSQYQRQATGLKPNEMYDREHSFIDDDLPVLKENFRKGFLETQTKVNSWFTNLKKKIDGEYDEEEDESQPSKHPRPGAMGRRSGEGSRKSTDYDRYDADPQVLSDDFAGMKLHPDGRSAQGRQSSSIYRPPPPSTSPKPEGRKVAFRESVEDIDQYEASPQLPPKDTSANPPTSKQSKWQPLSTVEPSPITDNDPFSLGDSEDEKDSKDKGGNKEIKMEDSERLKLATADAMADSLVGSDGKAGDNTASGKKD
ncbi:hypothetical protein F4779DRAFT_445242 [Xylariaceae sp. FL0662B]|nr:hypothetical protein F4779DRAFT_445242 [Xylariaceae sp. FL0662B]